MADVVRMFPVVRNEDVQRSEFSAHSGKLYKIPFQAEDSSFQMNIYISKNAVTTANFAAMTDGDILIDLSSAPIAVYFKEGDTSGDNFTTVTTTS